LTALAVATACSTLDAIDKGPGYDDGYGNASVEAADSPGHVLPPVGYQCYPRYAVRDGYVYDVYGHYYKEHNGDWSILRGAPSLVRYQEPEVSNDRRCVGYPF
jgi:hypothetical protein